MAIRTKSVIFKKDGEYTVFSKVYNAEKVEEPSHVDLVTKAITRGFSDSDFLALGTSTWEPFTVEIYPELNEKAKKKISKLIKADIIKIIENIQKENFDYFAYIDNKLEELRNKLTVAKTLEQTKEINEPINSASDLVADTPVQPQAPVEQPSPVAPAQNIPQNSAANMFDVSNDANIFDNPGQTMTM